MQELPAVPAVTDLHIRFQFLRHLSVRRGLYHITRALPNLSCLQYECRTGNNEIALMGQQFRQIENQFLFQYVLPMCKKLTKVCIYEDAGETFASPQQRSTLDVLAGRLLGSRTSKGLEELYVGWMVDAEDFLFAYMPSATEMDSLTRGIAWHRLKYLALTSARLHVATTRRDVFCAAAAAAECMPRLKTMDIRDETIMLGLLYYVDDRKHTLHLCVMGELEHEAEDPCAREAVIRAWGKVVALRADAHPLRVKGFEE